ncbi:MAG: ABC transporter ATP-binding protein [Planctomycetota bacterium]|nr:ABC transporter ATP-binding protein [Planctomycetota bacterium]
MVASDENHQSDAASERSLAIDLHDVRKTYPGRVEALRGVRMQSRRGEIFGLLGPNGAGKSTLVKIMLTVVKPSAASGSILGRPIGTKSVLSRVGYLPEKHRFPDYLTGRQAIEFAGAMGKVDRRTRRHRTTELLELVGMSDWGDRKVSTYSKGMQQRVGIAAAMVNEPDLVVLDEPTDGVDPVGRRDIRDVLLRIRDRGACVFLNSHLLSELEMVCDRMAIMVQGEVAAEGTIDDLTRDSRRYEIRIAGSPPSWVTDPAASAHGCSIATEEEGDRGTTRLLVGSDDPRIVQPLIDRLRSDARSIVSLQPIRESLEDLFLRFVKDPETGKARLPGAAGMAGRVRRTGVEG